MECMEILLNYLMFYVLENKVVVYFLVFKNYVLIEIMFELLVYIYENKFLLVFWVYFEY